MPATPGAAPEGPITARAAPSGGGPRPLHARRAGSGAGGFGAVWLARDETLRRDVAVKIVPRGPADDRRAARARGAGRRTPQPSGDRHAVRGGAGRRRPLPRLRARRRRRRSTSSRPPATSPTATWRGSASRCATRSPTPTPQGVVHRDVKPQNVIVPEAPQSAAGVAKLTDFGVASLAGDDPLTRTGDVVGTLAYMAPEQAEGRRAGPRADLYALALVVYEAFAGPQPGARRHRRRRRRGGSGSRSPRSAARARRPPVAPGRGRRHRAGRRARRARHDRRTCARRWRRPRRISATSRESSAGARLPRLALPVRAVAALWRRCAGRPRPRSRWAPRRPARRPAIGRASWWPPRSRSLPRLGWACRRRWRRWRWLILRRRPARRHRRARAGGHCRLSRCWPPAPRRPGRSRRSRPLLGLVGLAGAYPALAGQGRTAWSRAAIGALGFWWLAARPGAAGPRPLHRPAARDAAARRRGTRSASAAVPRRWSRCPPRACSPSRSLWAASRRWSCRSSSGAAPGRSALVGAAAWSAGAGRRPPEGSDRALERGRHPGPAPRPDPRCDRRRRRGPSRRGRRGAAPTPMGSRSMASARRASYERAEEP